MKRLALVVFFGAFAVEPGGLVRELDRMAPSRSFGPRLSVASSYQPCQSFTAPGATIPSMACPPGGQWMAPMRNLALRSARARDTRSSRRAADALHAYALIGLLWSGAAGKPLNESISSLRRASRVAQRPAGILADLAAAYLIRAERTQNARDLLEALEAAQQAVALEPRNLAARYNLALALDQFGLNGQATQAWHQYLEQDPRSGWAEEARSRIRQLGRPAAQPPLPGKKASAPEIQAYVDAASQQARLYGWETLLNEWGTAVLQGDSGSASGWLSMVEAMGEALERRTADATLADAAHAIRAAAGDRAAIRALALGHREYAAGQAASRDVDYLTAGKHFARVLGLEPPSRALRDWATVGHGSMLVYAGTFTDARRVLEALVARTDTAGHPALAGRARWALGTALLRTGLFEEALNTAHEARRLLARAGEHEHAAGAQYLAADAELSLGATVAAYGSTHRALATLRRYPGSVWLCNALSAAARTAEADGLAGAALRLQEERVVAAEATGHRAYRAEARLARAQALLVTRQFARAAADIRDSEVLVGRIPPGPARAWLEMDLRLARAGALLAAHPDQSVAILDTVLSTAGGSRTAVRELRARIGRAQARLALGNPRGAAADLDSATTLMVARRDAIARAPLRASLVEAAREIIDRLAMLELQAGDTAAALEYLERGRVSFGTSRPGGPERAAGPLRMPRGQVALDYALIGDTLLAWVVDHEESRLTRTTVSHSTLERIVEHTRSLLEVGASDAAVRPGLQALYDWLIRPLELLPGREGTSLVVVADGEIAGIPFAALHDAVSGRYLVETHAVRVASSLADAVRVPGPGGSPGAHALLVADPAFDSQAYPQLERLRSARAEVDSIAASYPGGTLLGGGLATTSAVVAGLQTASVVHFAGHAVFNEGRPEHSFLVLAHVPHDPAPGRLSAADFETIDLRGVHLFVLSACETLRAQGGRTGGFVGFAGALLGAGAGGVVGSLWKVDDRLTAPLMVEFHRAYRGSGNGADAMRAAQIHMLHSPHAAFRSPAAWAGFVYAGN